MNMQRVFGMPSGDTFDCPPIGEWTRNWLRGCKVIVDPFARNKKYGTFTNDLNPNTSADYHLDVLDFLELMVANGVQADAVIFDPPYSPRQIKELYDGIGITVKQTDAHRTAAWTKEKDLCDKLLKVGGLFLYYNWNTTGMGKNRLYTPLDILVVNHGSSHNDTLCMVERKEWKPTMNSFGG